MVGCYAESMLVRYNVVKVCNREYAHHGIALLCIAEYACICSACTLYDVQVVRYKAVMQSKRVCAAWQGLRLSGKNLHDSD